MFTCPLFHKFCEPNKTIKLKGGNTNTIPTPTCDWFITKQTVYMGASRVLLMCKLCLFCLERVALCALTCINNMKLRECWNCVVWIRQY